MSQQAQAVIQAQQKTAEPSSIKGSVLQRAAVIPAITPVHSGILQRCSGGVECEECRRKRLEREGMMQRAAVSASPVNSVPPIVHDVLSSSGHPLDAGTRTFMEPRFGYDFSQVRVHTDATAAESARAVNALAYTVGRDIVFDTGQYAPGTSAGKRLLTHELTHVVQQRSGTQGALQGKAEMNQPGDAYEQEAERLTDAVLSRETFQAQPSIFTPLVTPLIQRTCGAALGKPDTDCAQRTDDVSGEIFYFNINCNDLKPGGGKLLGGGIFSDENKHLSSFARGLPKGTVLKVHGYASMEGDPAFNLSLSCHRANKVASMLGKARPDLTVATPNVAHGATPGPASYRRSVVVETITPKPKITCDKPVLATTFDEYVGLVRCAELTFPSSSPREMLSLLRQIYYGHESWTKRSGRNIYWKDVIPCGLSIPNPEPTLGSSLFNALRNSQVVNGIDIGHVFTGLEAMVCPKTSVELNPIIVVKMPNEEFATWGGDLGSAAAQKVFDEQDQGLTTQPWSNYFLGRNTAASNEDLEGDIDGYIIRKGLLGTACSTTPLTPITTISAPISQILGEYYTAAATPVGATRTNRFACFAQAIGGVVRGRTITNKSSLDDTIASRVFSFADTYYLGLRKKKEGPLGVLSRPSGQGVWLLRYSLEVTRLFLDWLERKL